MNTIRILICCAIRFTRNIIRTRIGTQSKQTKQRRKKYTKKSKLVTLFVPISRKFRCRIWITLVISTLEINEFSKLSNHRTIPTEAIQESIWNKNIETTPLKTWSDRTGPTNIYTTNNVYINISVLGFEMKTGNSILGFVSNKNVEDCYIFHVFIIIIIAYIESKQWNFCAHIMQVAGQRWTRSLYFCIFRICEHSGWATKPGTRIFHFWWATSGCNSHQWCHIHWCQTSTRDNIIATHFIPLEPMIYWLFMCICKVHT